MNNIFIIRDKEIRRRCAEAVMQITKDPLMCVSIEYYKKKRTLLQNNYYWTVMKQIGDHLGYEDTEVHAYFKNKFLQREPIKVMGEYVAPEISTTKLNTKEFTEYMEKITVFCAMKIDFIVPPPSY